MIKRFNMLNIRIDNRKAEIRSIREEIHTNQSSQAFHRKEIEKLIGDNDKISDLNQAISELQKRLSALEAGDAYLPNRDYASTMTKESISDNIFYMTGPVN